MIADAVLETVVSVCILYCLGSSFFFKECIDDDVYKVNDVLFPLPNVMFQSSIIKNLHPFAPSLELSVGLYILETALGWERELCVADSIYGTCHMSHMPCDTISQSEEMDHLLIFVHS